MTTCNTCQGKRTVSITVPNMKGPSRSRYQSNITPYVTRNFQCGTCAGTGRVALPDCYKCDDTGLLEISDIWGGYDSTSPMPCDCDTAKAQVAKLRARNERERLIDAEAPF